MSTLQERITKLLAGPPKVSQASLARACGIKPPSVHDWMSGKTKSIEGENLLRAAAFLKVSPYWLATGKGSMRDRPNSEPETHEYRSLSNAERRALLEQDIDPLIHGNVAETAQPYRVSKEYPLISWVAAGCWQESCDNFQPGDAEVWLRSDENAGRHGYWLEVSGPSMEPTFTDGMRILVKPEGFDVISGKYYIAKLLDTGETTFKRYLRDGGQGFLRPLNPSYPVIPVTDKVAIIGQVIDARLAPIF